MIDFVYNVLAAVGYHHPIHAPATHIPMGMAIGGFLFALASLKRQDMLQSAYYCMIIALVSAPVVSLFGIMDWQHRYMGSWTNLIIAKMILAAVFIILLAATVYLHRRGNVSGKIMIAMYVLCMLVATALGYIGGEIVFG